MNLNNIKPKDIKVSDKYSSNLYKFLTKQIECNHVYFNPIDNYDGHKVELDMNNLSFSNIYIGTKRCDNDIIGKSLGTILTTGKIYDLICYCNNKEWIDITEEFWKRYDEIGRCLFIGHSAWYQDDNNTRFTYIDERTRVCNWCGKVEHKRIEPIIKEKVIWE